MTATAASIRRIVLVTGGRGAVGSGLIRSLRERGMIAIGAARGVTPGTEEVNADLSDASSVSEAFREVMNRFGRLDGVIHTAGGFASGGRLDQTDERVWDDMMDRNLRTAFLTIREALRVMRDAHSARIIVIGSASGIEIPPERGAYAISKAAVHHLVEVAAKECDAARVTINAIAPTIIDTPENRRWMSDADVSRWVTIDDIAEVALQLLDPTDRTTGQVIRLPRL